MGVNVWYVVLLAHLLRRHGSVAVSGYPARRVLLLLNNMQRTTLIQSVNEEMRARIQTSEDGSQSVEKENEVSILTLNHFKSCKELMERHSEDEKMSATADLRKLRRVREGV